MIRETVEKARTTVDETVDESLSRVRDRRRTGRKRLEEIFSRDVLGSVLVSLAAGKIVEQVIVILAPARPVRLLAWMVAFGLFVWMFVRWERLAAAAAEGADRVESAVDESA